MQEDREEWSSHFGNMDGGSADDSKIAMFDETVTPMSFRSRRD
jgi:hypothetical protein